MTKSLFPLPTEEERSNGWDHSVEFMKVIQDVVKNRVDEYVKFDAIQEILTLVEYYLILKKGDN